MQNGNQNYTKWQKAYFKGQVREIFLRVQEKPEDILSAINFQLRGMGGTFVLKAVNSAIPNMIEVIKLVISKEPDIQMMEWEEDEIVGKGNQHQYYSEDGRKQNKIVRVAQFNLKANPDTRNFTTKTRGKGKLFLFIKQEIFGQQHPFAKHEGADTSLQERYFSHNNTITPGIKYQNDVQYVPNMKLKSNKRQKKIQEKEDLDIPEFVMAKQYMEQHNSPNQHSRQEEIIKELEYDFVDNYEKAYSEIPKCDEEITTLETSNKSGMQNILKLVEMDTSGKQIEKEEDQEDGLTKEQLKNLLSIYCDNKAPQAIKKLQELNQIAGFHDPSVLGGSRKKD